MLLFSLQWNMALFDREKEGSQGLTSPVYLWGYALHTLVRLQPSAGATAATSEHEVRKASNQLLVDNCFITWVVRSKPGYFKVGLGLSYLGVGVQSWPSWPIPKLFGSRSKIFSSICDCEVGHTWAKTLRCLSPTQRGMLRSGLSSVWFDIGFEYLY